MYTIENAQSKQFFVGRPLFQEARHAFPLRRALYKKLLFLLPNKEET